MGTSLVYPLGEKGDWNHPLKYWAAIAYRLKDRIGGFEASIDSSIPVGSGLSSSAAISVAIAKGLNVVFELGLDDMEIAELAYQAEHTDLCIMCGRMDQYSIAFGGVTFIETGENPRVTRMPIKSLPMVVGDSREPRQAKHVLNSVKQRLLDGDPTVIDAFEKMLEGVLEGRKALERGDFRTAGEWMNRQQEQETIIGASTHKLNELCTASVDAGALGAKQMGAGGGGCMVAICPGAQARVSDAITRAGGKAWTFDVFHYADS